VKGRKVLFSSANDNWKTPEMFYKALDAEFNFDFDPCPSKPSFNGLKIEWGSCNYVNPPYSEIAKWVEKGYQEWSKDKTVVFLIPSRTDTKWWHKYIMKATEIRFIKGRLKFSNSKNSAPFPSVIVIYRHDY
jgi:phage N-6-adenine-methyltransferase